MDGRGVFTTYNEQFVTISIAFGGAGLAYHISRGDAIDSISWKLVIDTIATAELGYRCAIDRYKQYEYDMSRAMAERGSKP